MRIVMHTDDPGLARRACVIRPSHGLVARCAGCATPVTADSPHIHLLYGTDGYAGCCSEGCAIRAARLIDRSV